jgi:hypothetical protein
MMMMTARAQDRENRQQWASVLGRRVMKKGKQCCISIAHRLRCQLTCKCISTTLLTNLNALRLNGLTRYNSMSTVLCLPIPAHRPISKKLKPDDRIFASQPPVSGPIPDWRSQVRSQIPNSIRKLPSNSGSVPGAQASQEPVACAENSTFSFSTFRMRCSLLVHSPQKTVPPSMEGSTMKTNVLKRSPSMTPGDVPPTR